MATLKEVIERGLKVVSYPHPCLRKTAVAVRRVDDDLRTLARQMFDLMHENKGVGLACNQVGVPLRMFVCNPAGSPNPARERVFVNPVIGPGPGHRTIRRRLQPEGCLSLTDLNNLGLQVERPVDVWVEWEDLDGIKHNEKFTDLMAQIVQHEIDHLDGRLFTDLVPKDVAERINLAGWLNYMQTQWDFAVAGGHQRPSNVIEEEIGSFLDWYGST